MKSHPLALALSHLLSRVHALFFSCVLAFARVLAFDLASARFRDSWYRVRDRERQKGESSY